MDQATQKNAAMVEETTAASHGLAREAEALRQILSHFQISESGSGRGHDSGDYSNPVHKLVGNVRSAMAH